jgi:uncharacterized protein (TIGR00369 family)
MTPEEDLRALTNVRYWALIGMELLEVGDEGVHVRLRLGEQHLNYNDVVHGGVMSSLIDSAAGAAVRIRRGVDEARARPHATSDLHVTYYRPVTGPELHARGRVIRMGKTAVFARVDVLDEQERLVAHGNVTFIIGAARPSEGASSNGDAPA